MATRHLYLARHGAADAFGELTDTGYQQARLLGQRLANLPIDVVWHSPLQRAAASAQEIAGHLPNVPVIETPELVDHVPYVPRADETPPTWIGFFDGYSETEASAGQRIAETLVARFGGISAATTSRTPSTTHEISSRIPTPSRGWSGTRWTPPSPLAGTRQRERRTDPHRAPQRPSTSDGDVQRDEPPSSGPALDRVPRYWQALNTSSCSCASARDGSSRPVP